MNAPRTFWISLIVGFLVLGLETIALLQSRTIAQSTLSHAVWRRVYHWRYLFGFVLGLASTFVWYPSMINGERFKVLGIPFVMMMLDGAGKDYIGSLTFPSFLANMIVWLLIPDLVLWLWAKGVHASPASLSNR